MIWSDIASGMLLVLFAGAAFIPRFDFIGRWSVSLVGVWLQFAPLLFWAPTSAAYINDTLVGVLAITLSILVPTMPGMAQNMAMMSPGPDLHPDGHTTLPQGINVCRWSVSGSSDGSFLAARWSDMAAASALILVTLPRGTVRDRYGAWDAYVRYDGDFSERIVSGVKKPTPDHGVGFPIERSFAAS